MQHFRGQIINSTTMACEMSREEDLAMMNVDFGDADSPLSTEFVLSCFDEKKLYPRFYGKQLDKLKVYEALKKDTHPEVKTQWGDLRCHCSRIPILRLSKTARNLNKVFLTCGTPASAETRCKYFQWIHTSLFVDKRPLHKLKYVTNLSKAEWKQQAEANVETWKHRHGWYSKDAETQTEQKQQPSWIAEAAKNFAESAKKQEEQRKLQTKNPWKSNPLPNTFESSPEIEKELKKQKQWKEAVSTANHRLNSRVKGWSHLPPADANVAEYLTERKSKSHSLSPADEKFLNACIASKQDEWKPPLGAEKYEKNEVAIAKAVYEDWSFGYLPEKVCSLASYCRNKKQKGLSLTPVEERFFAHLVNVCIPEETDKEKQEREKRFFQECDANNAERRKSGLPPSSYETFRTFGTGIF